jgi:hypothetical protein
LKARRSALLLLLLLFVLELFDVTVELAFALSLVVVDDDCCVAEDTATLDDDVVVVVVGCVVGLLLFVVAECDVFDDNDDGVVDVRDVVVVVVDGRVDADNDLKKKTIRKHFVYNLRNDSICRQQNEP